MTKITTYTKNPYWADSDEVYYNYVEETLEEVRQVLIEKGYEKYNDFWIDKSDPDEPIWVQVAPFKTPSVSKLDDVI